MPDQEHKTGEDVEVSVERAGAVMADAAWQHAQTRLTNVLEAVEEADYRWHLFKTAKDPISQAMALTDLSNAMHDLRTWLPSFDSSSGTVAWERDDENDPPPTGSTPKEADRG